MSAPAAPGHTRPVTTLTLREMKHARRPIVMVTAYDKPSARLLDAAGVDVVLVGDSLGMVVLGHESTLPVSLDDMLHHTRAVVRGCKHALVVADMPFMSFQISAEEALRNAGRLMAEGGAQAVKLEGGVMVAQTVRRLADAGIPVMGHVGLTPQSVHQLGGYRIQGKDAAAALALLDDGRALQAAGAFAIVLECIPAELARILAEELDIPAIGIGAGPWCDGQVQVFHDLLGLGEGPAPRHSKQYADIGAGITQAVSAFADEVREGGFPTKEQSASLDPRIIADVMRTMTDRRPVGGGEIVALAADAEEG